MKNRIVLGILILISVFIITGCENKKAFTITCEGKKTDLEGIDITNKTIYNFGSDQIAIDYEVTSISIYESEEIYKAYKEYFVEESNNSTNEIEYNVKSNNKSKTINVNYKVKLPANKVNKMKDKDYYKAKKVLERAETDFKNKCTIEGIKRSELK